MKTLDQKTTIVVATGNPHKVVEIEAILGPLFPDKHFAALGELGNYPDPEETGTTFDENALIKARAALEHTGLTYAVADDSGLCVDVLDGAPGIYSARWAGEHGNDEANNEKLETALKDVEPDKRGAHFHSSVVLLTCENGQENIVYGEGDCPGTIGFTRRGTNGFGYDPLFLPQATPGKTMAELSADEKNAISHRYHALVDLTRKLRG